MKPYWKSIFLASVCSIFLGLLASILASLIGPCLQLMMPAKQKSIYSFTELLGSNLGFYTAKLTGLQTISHVDIITLLPVFLLSVAFLKLVFSISQYFLWEHLGELISKDLRQDLVQHYLLSSPMIRKQEKNEFFEASLSPCISVDIKMMREYLVHFYGGLPREALQILFLATVLITLSLKMFCIFFLCLIPAIYFSRKLGKKLRSRAGKALENYSSLTEWLQQRLLGIETIKHYRTESLEIEGMQNLSQELFSKFFRTAKVKARTSPIMEMIAISGVIGVLFIALQDIHEQTLTGSVAISFFASLVMLAQSSSMLAKYFNSNREGSAAIDRIYRLNNFLIRNQAEKRKFSPSLEHTNTLECKNISVTYADAKQVALQNFSYEFKTKRIYCLMGPSGAGKSTLFRTILGLIKPCSGSLAFSKNLSPQQIGYMPQDIVLMSGSIAEIISYPHTSWNEKDIWDALKKVDLHAFVNTLENQIDTKIGRGGSSLSGGQSQRLLLARLYFHKFRLILFDEGTSALDPEVEQCIYDGLLFLKNSEACIIMIAHRPSALQIADELIHLKDGILLDPKVN